LPGTQLEQINLLEIIRSSVNLFEKEKNSSVKVDLPFIEMPVMGDKEQALRIFNNVLKNAIQATQDVKDPVIRISAEEKDESFVIRISDNGTGIAENMKEKIFTPNFTTKSTGSGLGLAMVKSIVSNFGGKIWFESQEGLGSTFFIEFRKAI
jgi:signal transduction histidine kinase